MSEEELELKRMHDEHLKRANEDAPEPFKIRVVQFDNKLLG
jgi:hypothetical protein